MFNKTSPVFGMNNNYKKSGTKAGGIVSFGWNAVGGDKPKTKKKKEA